MERRSLRNNDQNSFAALSNLQERGILGFLGMNQRQIVLLERQELANFGL